MSEKGSVIIAITDELVKSLAELGSKGVTMETISAAISAFVEANIAAEDLGKVVAKYISGEELTVFAVESTPLHDSSGGPIIGEVDRVWKGASLPHSAPLPPGAKKTIGGMPRRIGNVVINKDSGGGMPPPSQTFKKEKRDADRRIAEEATVEVGDEHQSVVEEVGSSPIDDSEDRAGGGSEAVDAGESGESVRLHGQGEPE